MGSVQVYVDCGEASNRGKHLTLLECRRNKHFKNKWWWWWWQQLTFSLHYDRVKIIFWFGSISRLYSITTLSSNLLTFRPLAFGKRFSAGTLTLSMAIWPVMLARRENFPSIRGAVKPSMPFSRMNPRIRFWWASDLAQMINTSAIGEFVILNEKSHSKTWGYIW